MGRPPLDPTTGPQTAAQRSAKRHARKRKSINGRRRSLYKIANESETRKAKRARRAEILAGIARRTQAAMAALNSPAMPLCNLITIDIPWPHENFSVETGSDRGGVVAFGLMKVDLHLIAPDYGFERRAVVLAERTVPLGGSRNSVSALDKLGHSELRVERQIPLVAIGVALIHEPRRCWGWRSLQRRRGWRWRLSDGWPLLRHPTAVDLVAGE
jgi:hypothetical protein